jgi:hypothetical protein
VPSSTIVWSSPSTLAIGATQNHARALRVLLEQLDDLARERNQLVSRAQRLADADDISTRIQKEAAGLETWAEVQPSMFEDTLDQELVKYDKFRHDIEEGAAKQMELLGNVKESLPQKSFISDRHHNPFFFPFRPRWILSCFPDEKTPPSRTGNTRCNLWTCPTTNTKKLSDILTTECKFVFTSPSCYTYPLNKCRDSSITI